MPDRLYREAMCTSRTVNALSAEAERFMCRLWTTCDGHGRFEADVQVIRARTFPLKTESDVTLWDIAEWIDDLQAVGTIELYEHEEYMYGMHPNWTRHNKLRAGSRFPEPPHTRLIIVMRQIVAVAHYGISALAAERVYTFKHTPTPDYTCKQEPTRVSTFQHVQTHVGHTRAQAQTGLDRNGIDKNGLDAREVFPQFGPVGQGEGSSTALDRDPDESVANPLGGGS